MPLILLWGHSCPVDTFLAALVVATALFRVAEDLINVCNLLELPFCFLWIVSILIRVVLDSQLFVLLLDLSLRGVAVDTKELVVILFLAAGCI